MLDRILEGFLQNTEQTKGDLLRQFFRDIFGVELNLHMLPIGEFPAKTSCRRCETQVVQLRGMELV